MAVVYRGITAPKVTPELMDEMVIRVEERIAFKHRFGSYISRLSLALQLVQETNFEECDAIATLEEAVEDLLAEWGTL